MINIKIFLIIDHQKLKVERIFIVIQIYGLHQKEWLYKIGIN